MKSSRIKIDRILRCFLLQNIAHFLQVFCFFNAESSAGV